MVISGFSFFDTAIGRCGIGWTNRGVRATQLPATGDPASRDRLARHLPGSAEAMPPPSIADVIARISRHLAGEAMAYADIALDDAGVGAFERAVYNAAAAIPFGGTRSYGALAASLGRSEAAQAVGQALGRNPWPIIIPCHRILGADGKAGGFSAPGGAATKLRLLEIEGALAAETLPLFAGAQAG